MAADERKEDTTNSDAQTAYDITSFATPKLKFTEEYSTDKGTPTQINESERLDLAKTVIPSMITLVLGFYFGRKDT